MKVFLRKILGQKLINYFHLYQAILANLIYGFPSRKLKVIGVTGTDGKTTTVNLIASIFKESGRKVSFLSSINAQIGEQEFDTGLHTTTPSSFLLQKFLKQMVKAGSEFAVLEVTSHALDQYRVWGIRFETAVLTNVTPEHLDYHKTFEEYTKAKLKLFKNVEYRILNIDDSTSLPLSPYPGERVSLKFPSPRDEEGLRERLITYGLTSTAQIWADNIKEDLKSTSFTCHIQSTPSSSPTKVTSSFPSPLAGEGGPSAAADGPDEGGARFDLSRPPGADTLPRPGEGKRKWQLQGGEMRGWLNLPGKFNVLNALAAICVGQIYKIPKAKIKAGLEKVTLISGRMEFIDEGKEFLALVDFAHTPNALENLLSFLRPKITGRIILVFGCAGERDTQKRPKMGEAADQFADIIVLTREDNRSESVQKICNDIAAGIRQRAHDRGLFVITDRREAIGFALSKARKNDIVVITGKGHEQSLNVDGIETPWDDRKVMREEIYSLRSTN